MPTSLAPKFVKITVQIKAEAENEKGETCEMAEGLITTMQIENGFLKDISLERLVELFRFHTRSIVNRPEKSGEAGEMVLQFIEEVQDLAKSQE